MSDPIDRQAAIDALEGEITVTGSANAQAVKGYVALVADRLKRLPSAQPEPKWVPCSERLPEDYTDVLVWFEYFRYGSYNRMYQTYGIGTYSGQYDSWMINHESGWNNLRVIAWMPLPDPWEEGYE